MNATQRAAKIAACTVTESGNGWDVQSPSGSTYHVIAGTHTCNCPARGDCVHMAACGVGAMVCADCKIARETGDHPNTKWISHEEIRCATCGTYYFVPDID